MNTGGGLIYRLGPEEDLLRTLECPVCADVPIPPIFSCETGHIVCNDCKGKLQNCPLCRSKFLTVRNFPLESIVNSSAFRCPNEGDGCKDRIKGCDYKAHIKNCDYGAVKCNYIKTRKCDNQLIPMRLFSNHLKEYHGYETHTVPETGITFNINIQKSDCVNHLWPIACFNFKDEIFLKRAEIKNSMYTVIVKFLGPRRIGLQYKVKVRIFNNDKDIEVEYKFPVQNIHKNDDDILNDGLCFSIPLKQLMAIANENSPGKWDWKTTFVIYKQV